MGKNMISTWLTVLVRFYGQQRRRRKVETVVNKLESGELLLFFLKDAMHVSQCNEEQGAARR